MSHWLWPRLALLALSASFVPHVGIAAEPVRVTVDNFARAESDLYMSKTVKGSGLGKLAHRREPTSIDKQDVIRMNRDTLYSAAVFDLDAGPVTITLPDAGNRCQSP